MTLRELRRHRHAIDAIARRRGVTSVLVFGSTARGEPKPGSDVDFLVELESGRTLLDLGGFQHGVSELLGRPVQVVTPGTDLGRRIATEAVPL